MKYVEGYGTRIDDEGNAYQELIFRVIYDFGEVVIEKAAKPQIKAWNTYGIPFNCMFPLHLAAYRGRLVKPEDGEVFLYALSEENSGSQVMSTVVEED